MTNFRRGSSRQGRGGIRRETDWGTGTGGTGVTSFTTSSSAFIGSGLIVTTPGVTLIRIRGILNCFLVGAPGTDGDGFFGAFGIGLVEEPAFTAGITSVPTPITDDGSENWLYHKYVSVHHQDVSATGGHVTSDFMVEIDSKSMRKFPTTSRLYAAMEVVEIGAATMDVFHDSRVLFKLP